MALLASLLFLTVVARGAVVVDRIAVIVGKHVIKLSDIEHDLRLTQFLNSEPLNLSGDGKRKQAERAIDQQLIRTELDSGGYSRATDSQAEALLHQIIQERYGGSESKMRAALRRYGVTEEELRAQLVWQLTVLDFIQQRFRPEVAVSDDQVRAYYDQHIAEFRREHPDDSSYETLEPEVRDALEGEPVTKEFENWLGQQRQQTKIQFRQGAFQ
jgi:hypothetical protein